MATGIPVSLAAADIEHELAAMWGQRSGESEPDPAGSGVIRITLGNVIWLGTSRHAPRIRRVFSQLVSKYPCRLFLLEFTDDPEDAEIHSFINAYCFVAGGVKHEVCCEEIHLQFGRKALPHVAGAILPLLVADVPTFLWYFTSNPGQYEAILPRLIRMADHAITELAYLPDPVDGLRAMAESTLVPTSFAWLRYVPIREQIAAVFDDERCGRLLPAITTLRVGWIGESCDNQAMLNASLLVGWFASRLGWRIKDAAAWPFEYQGPSGTVRVESFCSPAAESCDAAQVVHFEMICSTGDSILLRMCGKVGQMERVTTGPSRVAEGAPRFVNVRAFDEAQALGYAFNSRLGDRPFRDAAALAWPLLAGILKHKDGRA